MFNKSIGIIETEGISSALLATIEILKETNLKIIKKQIIGEGITAVIVEGELGAMQNAFKLGADLAKENGRFRTAHIIPMPHSGLQTYLNLID